MIHIDNPHLKFSFTRLFTNYWERLPLTIKDAFWFRPLAKYPPKGSPGFWYSTVAIGKNKLGHFVSEIMHDAGFGDSSASQERYTNHSLRNVTANTLISHGFSDFDVMSRTGHTSVNSLQSYRRKNPRIVKEMSEVLAGPATSASSSYMGKRARMDNAADQELDTKNTDTKTIPIDHKMREVIQNVTLEDLEFGSIDGSDNEDNAERRPTVETGSQTNSQELPEDIAGKFVLHNCSVKIDICNECPRH